jgi:integrase/recombinase XerD
MPRFSRHLRIVTGPALRCCEADCAVITGAFAAQLQQEGYRSRTVRIYVRQLMHVARWLAPKGRSIRALDRVQVGQLLARPPFSQTAFRAANFERPLHCWLRFIGRLLAPAVQPASQSSRWLDDYARFLREQRGLVAATCREYIRDARVFLSAQFGTGAVRWAKIRAQDIWLCCEQWAREGNASYTKNRFHRLRRFLGYVHLRGACPSHLIYAVSRIPNWSRREPAVYSGYQRRKFLASFHRHSAHDKRGYAMACCLAELGLRSVEVANLRLGDVDLEKRQVLVPAAKRGRRRRLPLPGTVATALHDYIDSARPDAVSADRLFVGHHKFHARPVTATAVQSAMRAAYIRSGLPMENWRGTHRFRHTFATRLQASGATLKQIADLLGHRNLDSTDRYTHAALPGLRIIAQPWPH